jgi:hypothetical protein
VTPWFFGFSSHLNILVILAILFIEKMDWFQFGYFTYKTKQLENQSIFSMNKIAKITKIFEWLKDPKNQRVTYNIKRYWITICQDIACSKSLVF